jgi:PBP1b-binding outer membrane lipoprotein LpoB
MNKLITILSIAIMMSACTAMAGQPNPEVAKKPAVSELAQSLATKYKELSDQQQKAAEAAMATKEFKAYTATKEFKNLQAIIAKMKKIKEAYDALEPGAK